VPYEAAREQVAARLSAAAWERAVAQYVSVLAGAAQLEGVDLNAAASPLVQ
jgi:peptidyl-prolyl cis-trans isomerase C